LAYYNKVKNPQLAKAAMEKAFALNPGDVRILLELDQLYKKLGMSFADRRKNLEDYQKLIDQRDDLYIEYITLLNITGEPEKAYQCIMGHKFHPWEGGEGKVTTQYTLALLAMARKAMKKSGKCYDRPEVALQMQLTDETTEKATDEVTQETTEEVIEEATDVVADEASVEAAQDLLHQAEAYLRLALDYPENLGEGKLEGTKDNHVYYHLGLVLEALGDKTEADACFAQAAVGSDEVAGAMYYNDQPADMILYQGLANLKLGRTSQAKSRFYRLIDYGEQHVDDQVKIEYFAVSLPDFLIFEDEYTVKNKAHCFYLMALGNIGLNHIDKAKGFLEQTRSLEPSHMMSNVYMQMIG
jgi:tetratricopeptide (TPR) repeat protein